MQIQTHTSLVPPVVNMPLPGEATAPRFRGRSSAVGAFIKHYERLLARHNITDPAAQCDEVLQYCTPKVAAFVRGCAGYHTHSWAELKAELLEWYAPEPPAALDAVRRHAAASRYTPIRTLAQWKRYYRVYCAAAGALYHTHQLSDREYRAYFWSGIPPGLRTALERRLYERHGVPAEPWPVEDVCAAAREHLTQNRMLLELTGGGEHYGREYTGTETDSEDESESDDSESEGTDSDDIN